MPIQQRLGLEGTGVDGLPHKKDGVNRCRPMAMIAAAVRPVGPGWYLVVEGLVECDLHKACSVVVCRSVRT